MNNKQLLTGIVIILLLTNIYTLFFLKGKDKKGLSEDHYEHFREEEGSADEIVAQVGEVKITYKDWVSSLQRDVGKKHLKDMIDRELVKALFAESGLQIHDKLIEKEIAYLASMQGIMTPDEIEKEEEKWRADALFRYQLEALLTEGETVSEEEIQNHFYQYGSQYNFTASMQFSHIVVENEEIAQKVKSELDEGADFHLLAQEYSKDEDTQAKGGYLGYYTTASRLVPAKYFEIGGSMQEHSYSEPFQVDQGFAMIYLHRSLPDIEFTYEEIKEHIKNELILTKLEQPLTTDPLWEKLDIDWIFKEENE